ncbi:MAG TPA: radical SAM protein [Syntrophomonadaceae bacterium]|nr:radical SAM protein [Syntrophomonadaceae bacterium]
MKSAKQLISTAVLNQGINSIDRDPVAHAAKLVNWGSKLAIRDNHKRIAENFRQVIDEPDNHWNKLIQKVLTEYDKNIVKKFILNFMVNATILGVPQQEKYRAKYHCNVPWAILMDPTAACNLKCTGCWAAEYKKSDSLSNETLDRIIREGKDLGIYMYIYSGGEPLVRKHDLIKLAKEHDDCMFLAFTNATLVDDEFASEMADAGNFLLAISVEGGQEETDMRRGQGTYQKVMQAMDILKQHGVPFGFSTCYHRYNTKSVGSDEYIDLMIDKGCLFGWYFTYMPLGKDAKMDLLATTEQREYMYHRVRELRDTKPIFVLDFWNDGEYTEGCIAGGKKYLHINANGDVEPCAFIHYSNVNIKNASLLEALQSPIFKQYYKGQPFNENHLRPCPLLDNPEKLAAMVHASGAVSTQPIDQESVDELTSRTKEAARNWSITAEHLWQQHLQEENEIRNLPQAQCN